jgi:hypothetical protein
MSKVRVIKDDLWVCNDCLYPIVSSSFNEIHFTVGTDRLVAGLTDGYLAIGDELRELSGDPCACCGTRLTGARCEVLVLAGKVGELTGSQIPSEPR